MRCSPQELSELIEEVIIPETWFFRDQQPFALLGKLVKEWQQSKEKTYLRLLSAPCSSGEEPYSLVITLLDAGWPIDKFQVVALDISARSLARAQKGEYSGHSFRGEDLSFRDRYFNRTGTAYVLKQEARSKVHFHQGNLLNQAFMAGLGLFDVVFCKNVLIYLDNAARDRAIKLLTKVMARDGVIFVGHAETQLFANRGFISLATASLSGAT